MSEAAAPTGDRAARRRTFWLRLLLAGLIVAVFVGILLSDHAPEPVREWLRFLEWDYLKAQRSELNRQVEQHFVIAVCVFVAVYVVFSSLAVPGAWILTVIGGLLFGPLIGTIIVSLASTTGATVAFLGTRYLLRDWVQQRFAGTLDVINRGVEADGAYYLLTLRLVPLFPFFLINVTMGLTRMRVWTFWWVSQLGMLPMTFVYVNAGSELGQIEHPGDIVSPTVLISLALIGIAPLLLRKAVQWWANAAAKRR